MLQQLRKQLPQYSKEEFKKHFHPYYNPWDQRLCAVSDSDLFKALRNGSASVVTDHISHFDANGIQLKSGDRVDADVIITATGLTLQHNFPMSTAKVSIDGKPYEVRGNFHDMILTRWFRSGIQEPISLAHFLFFLFYFHAYSADRNVDVSWHAMLECPQFDLHNGLRSCKLDPQSRGDVPVLGTAVEAHVSLSCMLEFRTMQAVASFGS